MRKIYYITTLSLLIFSCSKEGELSNHSDSALINMPPMQILLTPVSPVRGDVITADYSYSVPGVDSMFNIWVVESETLHQKGKNLQTAQFPVGASIKALVFVFFDNGYVKTFESSSVKLASPASASVAAARIGPDSVTVTGAVRLLRIEIIGDKENFSFSSKWYRNNSPVYSATDTVLHLGGFKRGDEIFLKLIDGNGVEYMTNTIIIANSPPAITSTPPSVTGEGPYTYQLIGLDADGDRLFYSLSQSPPGMTVNETGLLVWENPIEGSHPVTVEVSDGNGAKAAQAFTLKFTVQL
ncbi:hypothetical protein JW890_02510 [candidate division WOR-3 bacterium]|nr:hypothetical protein [candidate division WOR-3 bacterium]